MIQSLQRIFTLFLALLVLGCFQSKVQELHPEANQPANNLRLLTGRAGLIFKGVVSSIEYETDTQTGLPYTYVTFRQIEAIKDLTDKFKADNREKIRIRNFGGLNEAGQMIESSHVPNFILGGVYLVFYTAGDWDLTPIVGGENGVFQVLKSRTLGYEMLISQSGQVVVSIENDSIQTLDLGLNTLEVPPLTRTDIPEQPSAMQNTSVRMPKIDKNSIYTEENVKKMMEQEEGQRFEPENESNFNQQRDSLKIKALRNLSSPPMSLKDFSKLVMETNDKYRDDFAKFYSKVNFEGRPVQKEKTPVSPGQK